MFKFPKFSRFFSNFRGFSWISAVVTSGVLKTGSNLTPLDAIHTETEHNQYKYLYIPHLSLSLLCENGAGAIASAPFYTTGDSAKPDDTAAAAAADHTGSTLNVHPLLSSFINYTHPIKFQGN